MESLNDIAYSATATATGGRGGRSTSEDGTVDVELGKPGSGKANPETLFAAGYAACFGGALAKVSEAEGVDASDSSVTAEVEFGTTDTGFGLAVKIAATVPGVDDAVAADLAEKAHQMCPYSKATRGNIDVTVTATGA